MAIAQIIDGVVLGVDRTTHVPHDETWRACPADVSPGFVFDGEAFAPPASPPPTPPAYLPVALLRERLEALGRYEAVVAVLLAMLMSNDAALGAKVFKLLTLAEGVHRDDPDLAAVLAAAQLTEGEVAAVLA